MNWALKDMSVYFLTAQSSIIFDEDSIWEKIFSENIF